MHMISRICLTLSEYSEFLVLVAVITVISAGPAHSAEDPFGNTPLYTSTQEMPEGEWYEYEECVKSYLNYYYELLDVHGAGMAYSYIEYQAGWCFFQFSFSRHGSEAYDQWGFHRVQGQYHYEHLLGYRF